MNESFLSSISEAWFHTYGWIEANAFLLVSNVSVFSDVLIFAALALLGLYILKKILFRPAPADADLRRVTRRPRFFGFATATALIVSLVGWSVFAPLASASIAFGVVSPDGNRKEISHLEGGIVRSIHVREGETVKAGAPLVTMEDVRARAEFDQLNDRLVYLVGNRARLEALRDERPDIIFPAILADFDTQKVGAVIEGQAALLDSQRIAHSGREKIHQQRIQQIAEHTKGLEQVIDAQSAQLTLLATEIGNFQTLLDKGLTQASRLFSLQRDHAALSAELAMNRARISENSQVVSETELKLLNLREEVREDANDQLASIENQIDEIYSQLATRLDVLNRTVIHAPNAGTIVNLQIATVGGVLHPGQPILELVPESALLIIDARVKPTDIDRVRRDMKARIVLSAYKQRNLPMIHGRILSVSADRLEEDRTGEPYYLAKVEVDQNELALAEGVELIPGMPAEVLILNGQQTVLQFLLDPIAASFNRSFRES